MKAEPTRATQGISFELPILRSAKERAVSRRMSLSAYVNQLIFDDLKDASSPPIFAKPAEEPELQRPERIDPPAG